MIRKHNLPSLATAMILSVTVALGCHGGSGRSARSSGHGPAPALARDDSRLPAGMREEGPTEPEQVSRKGSRGNARLAGDQERRGQGREPETVSGH